MNVLVTHPGRQHSHQAALALERAGMLAGYWAGAPTLATHGHGWPAPLRRRFLRYAPVDLPPGKVRWLAAIPALRRLGDLLLPGGANHWLDYFACRLFDQRVARALTKLRPDAVLACEISALTTFRRARRLGILTLLDAPSIHHRAQDALHGFAEPAALHRRIVAVKDCEIALADHVITVSELARSTYLEAGVPPERAHALMLGADLELFQPASEPRPEQAPFTFLFSGAMIRRKGFDLLVEAFARVHATHPSARLVLVGPRGDAAGALEGRREGVLERGTVPQAELARAMQEADCLVLPSRNDSYGMVVAEALACGLPVIVSSMVGSKELVRAGEAGWIVEVENVDALAERMLACAESAAAVRALRNACRSAAQGATWSAYHARFAELVRGLGARTR